MKTDTTIYTSLTEHLSYIKPVLKIRGVGLWGKNNYTNSSNVNYMNNHTILSSDVKYKNKRSKGKTKKRGREEKEWTCEIS